MARGAAPAVALYAGVARAPGFNGTAWRSSAVIYNPTAAPQSALLELLPRGGSSVSSSQTLQLAPGETREIPNLYDFLAAQDGAGMLRVTGNVIAWVRTYNQGSGTFGQDVPAVSPGEGFAPSAAVVFPYSTPADIASEFRSNLLLVNLDTADITMTFDAGGVRQTMAVAAGTFVQINNLGAFLGTPVGVGVVRISADGRWFGIVSTIDPVTGDPTAMRGVSLADTGPHMFAGAASAPGVNGAFWRSEVVLNNPGSSPAQALLELIPSGQGQVSASSTVALDSGATIRIPDLYQFLGVASGAGVLRVSGGVLAWARTYNQQGSQTFGQDLPQVTATGGFSPREPVVFPFRSPADVATDFRSNLLLLNLDDMDITVSLRAGNATNTQTVPAGSFMQINNLGAFLGTPAGTGTVWVTADGYWTGSMATIDPLTNDPTPFRAVEGWQPPTSADLINQALSTGAINTEQALVYKVFADFLDPRLPPQFQGDDRNVLEMPSVDEAVQRFASLSPATQDLIGPFLVPAYYEGSWWDLLHPAGTRAPGAASTARPAVTPSCHAWLDSGCPILTSLWAFIDGPHLRVWYEKSKADTDGKTAVDLAYQGENVIWPELKKVMGIEPLLASESDGSSRLDVILNHGLGKRDGYTGPVLWTALNWHCQANPTFIVLDADSGDLRPTLAHELMHAAQHALDLQNCSTKVWLGEATATWFEDDVYPGPPDSEHPFAWFYLNSPDLSLDDVSKPFRDYSGYLFFFYLTKVRDKPLPTTVVGDAWRAVAGSNPLDPLHAVAYAIKNSKNGADIDKVWPDFALYNWNAAPPFNRYKLLDRLKTKASLRLVTNLTDLDQARLELESASALKMPHLSIRYYRVDFPDDKVSTLTFFNGLERAVDTKQVSLLDPSSGLYFYDGYALTAPRPADPSLALGAHVDALLQIDGNWTHEDWTGKPFRTFCRDKIEERLQSLVIILSNADLSNDVTAPGPKGPLLSADNVGCFAWNGRANLSIHYPPAINDSMQVTNLRVEPLGTVNYDADTPLFSAFTTVGGTFTWKLSGTTVSGCTVTGEVDNASAVDARNGFATFPFITDGPAQRGLRMALPYPWVNPAAQYPAKFTNCKGTKDYTTNWFLSPYFLVALEFQALVKVSQDGKSIDIDVSKIPGAGQANALTGTWHFDSQRQQ